MNNIQQLKDICATIRSKRGEYFAECENLIKESFSDTETIGIPSWLEDAVMQDDSDLSVVYAHYNHDGAWVRVSRVTRKRSTYDYIYTICGQEVEEYTQDWVSDIQIFNPEDVANILICYFNSGYPSELADITSSLLSDPTRDCFDILSDWCRTNGYHYNIIDLPTYEEWAASIRNNN